MANLKNIEGVGPAYARKLRAAGVATTDALLKKGASPLGRKEIAKASGINGSLVLRWVNHADLFRIKGVGEEYADLLEAAGVDTVPELAQRSPQNLSEKMATVNKRRGLVRQLPSEAQVKSWVSQAKRLRRVVTY